MKTRRTLYKNGFESKFDNKRVQIEDFGNGDFRIRFVRLDTDKDNHDKPSCKHEIVGGKIRVTSFRVSAKALEELVIAYSNYSDRNTITYVHEG